MEFKKKTVDEVTTWLKDENFSNVVMKLFEGEYTHRFIDSYSWRLLSS